MTIVILYEQHIPQSNVITPNLMDTAASLVYMKGLKNALISQKENGQNCVIKTIKTENEFSTYVFGNYKKT